MRAQKNIIIVGAGGVASAFARKAAQYNHLLGAITVASRTLQTCRTLVASAMKHRRDKNADIQAAQLDAKKIDPLAALIKKTKAAMVVNLATPHVNLSVMESCLQSGAHYLDTALYEKEGVVNMPPPWYADYEWRKKTAFAKNKLTGILSVGFDPGAVNVFCAHARQKLFDEIDSIDIMDINDGRHKRYFATNFDAHTNLREILENPVYWQNGEWKTIAPHSKSFVYDFPNIGARRVYSMGHEEIHSLAKNIAARRIEFWMGFSPHYLKVFGVLNKLGLLSEEKIEVDGAAVIPIRLIRALLPKPQDLAAEYRGDACIGCLIAGQKNGEGKKVFIHSNLSHEAAYKDVGAQAVSYSTAVPALAATLLVLRGDWRIGKLVNAEELNPQPFLDLMPKLGIEWAVL